MKTKGTPKIINLIHEATQKEYAKGITPRIILLSTSVDKKLMDYFFGRKDPTREHGFLTFTLCGIKTKPEPNIKSGKFIIVSDPLK